MARTATVIGASGFVGRFAARELLGRGWRVRALVRDVEKARRVLPRHDQLAVVRGSATAEQDLADALHGAQACVNTVGIIRATRGNSFQTAHVAVPRAIVRAMEGAGVRRLVHVSALGVSAEGRAEYQRSKFEGERVIRSSGLDWTILRPSLIHGPGGEFVAMAAKMARGQLPPWIAMPYFMRSELTSDVPLAASNWVDPVVQPVAVEEVAWAIAESLVRNEAVQEIYNLAGPDRVSWPQLLRAVRDAVPGANGSLDPLGVPDEHGAIIARVASALGVGSLLPFDAGMALMAAEDTTAALDKARADLGFDPRPFRESLSRYARAC